MADIGLPLSYITNHHKLRLSQNSIILLLLFKNQYDSFLISVQTLHKSFHEKDKAAFSLKIIKGSQI